MNISILKTSGGSTPETYADVSGISVYKTESGSPGRITVTQTQANKEVMTSLSYTDVTSITITPPATT